MSARSPSSCGYCRKIQFKNMADKGASSAKKSQSVTRYENFRIHSTLAGLAKIEGQGLFPEA